MKNVLLMAVMILGLSANANVITNNENLMTKTEVTETDAFCTLIQNGEYLAVKSMIDAGTDVNRKSKGLTPLMYAARQNKVEIVKLLLANGADIKVKSNRGQTALEWAINCKAYATEAVLIQAQKDRKKNKRKRK